jgi:malonyl CoA-acyl carrier protein transacylase
MPRIVRPNSLFLLLTLSACASEFTRVLPNGNVEHELHLQHMLAPQAVEAMMRQSTTSTPYQVSILSKNQSRTLVVSGDPDSVRATVAALRAIDVPQR